MNKSNDSQFQSKHPHLPLRPQRWHHKVKVDRQTQRPCTLFIDRKSISCRSWLAGGCCWGEGGRDAGSGCLIWAGLALRAVVLNCYRTDGYESGTLQAGADISPRLHSCVLIPIASEWSGRGHERRLPPLTSDYFPASAESDTVQFDLSALRPGCVFFFFFLAVWRRFVQRQTRWFLFVFCFAGVCWIALLQESLVIHGCSEEGALPHYGCRSLPFRCRLWAFKKLIEKYCLSRNNAAGLWETD